MQVKYRVAITGLRDGHPREQVVDMLAALFKSGREQIERGLDAGGIVLNTPDLEAARRYQALLWQRGCVCRIDPAPAAPAPEPKPARPLPPDPAEAARRIRSAAELGHASAQYQLAGLYRAGGSLPRDMAQALAWYRKAAEQGDAAAQFALAEIYVKGPEVPQDFAEAAAWAKKAAAQGHADAQHYLGAMYDNGDGTPRDPGRALLWYRKAAAQGQAKARARLAVLEAQQAREVRAPVVAGPALFKPPERRFAANYQGLGLLIRWVGTLVILLVLIVYAKWHRAHPTPPQFAELPRIKELIGDVLTEGDMICKRAGPFPFDSRTPPPGYTGFSSLGWRTPCQDCDALVDAGLLSRSAAAAQGATPAGTVYELTDLGRTYYREEVRDLDGQSAAAKAWRDKVSKDDAASRLIPQHEPGFCFADKTVLHEVTDALPPMMLSGTRYISVKYVVEAVNPSPMMASAAFRSLKLPLPAANTPGLYAPRIVTYAQSQISSDPGTLDFDFRYGPWALPTAQ